MSNRIQKVNSLLKHELSNIIFKDFDFSEVLVTLTHVEVTTNLIDAKAYISVFPEDKIDDVINILNRNIYKTQQKINKLLKMRPIPKIKFVKDREISKAGRIEELLGQLKNK